MDIKELKNLIKLCRAEGIDKISISDVHIEFGVKPHKLPKQSSKPRKIMTDEEFSTLVREESKILEDHLTEEQALMWSVEGASN